MVDCTNDCTNHSLRFIACLKRLLLMVNSFTTV